MLAPLQILLNHFYKLKGHNELNDLLQYNFLYIKDNRTTLDIKLPNEFEYLTLELECHNGIIKVFGSISSNSKNLKKPINCFILLSINYPHNVYEDNVKQLIENIKMTPNLAIALGYNEEHYNSRNSNPSSTTP